MASSQNESKYCRSTEMRNLASVAIRPYTKSSIPPSNGVSIIGNDTDDGLAVRPALGPSRPRCDGSVQLDCRRREM
jgi:hypothetical protein